MKARAAILCLFLAGCSAGVRAPSCSWRAARSGAGVMGEARCKLHLPGLPSVPVIAQCRAALDLPKMTTKTELRPRPNE